MGRTNFYEYSVLSCARLIFCNTQHIANRLMLLSGALISMTAHMCFMHVLMMAPIVPTKSVTLDLD